MANDITLTDDQKMAVLKIWNESETPPALMDIVKSAFPEKNYDGRSKQGRSVSKFLRGRNLKARSANEYLKKDAPDLTPDQKVYISNHCALMKPLEIARAIFNNRELTNLNNEVNVVRDYVKTLDPKITHIIAENEDQQEDSGYKPPKSLNAAVHRVNKYVHIGMDKDKLTPIQKKSAGALLGYLHTFRYSHQINTYTSEEHRTLFESSFVRYTHDKSDLTEEEVDQYIVLATEVVISSSIQANVVRLQGLLDDIADDTEGRRISMSLVESISSARTEYNQCVTRQQKLLNDLKIKRSERISKQVKENASILNLVEVWKDEESRIKMIKLANMRKQIVEKEIENLSTMDEIKCRIFGLSKEEGLNG